MLSGNLGPAQWELAFLREKNRSILKTKIEDMDIPGYLQ